MLSTRTTIIYATMPMWGVALLTIVLSIIRALS